MLNIYRIPVSNQGTKLKHRIQFAFKILSGKDYFFEIDDATVEALIDAYSKKQASAVKSQKLTVEERNAYYEQSQQ